MRPLLFPVLAFASGILLAERFSLTYSAAFAAIFLFLLLSLFLYFRRAKFSPLFAAPLFFFLGALFILPYIRPELPSLHIKKILAASSTEDAGKNKFYDIYGTVVDVFDSGKERTRLVIESIGVFSEGEWKKVQGRVLVTVDGRLYDIRPGDGVRFLAHLREPWSFGNPGEFDYRRYLHLRGIHVTGFVEDKRFFVKTGEGSPLYAFFFGLRERVGSFIDGSGVRNRSLIKALSIGERADLPEDLEEAFRRTGTSHILSISGLHVGMAALFAYGFFLFLLKRSERLMLALNAKKVCALLSIAPVVLYGAVSGLTLPTQRSVIMIVSFIFALSIGRGRDLFNTTALAALIILVIAPYSIWDVSMQLTFAAIFAILYFVPRLRKYLDDDGETKKEGGDELSWMRMAVKWRLLPLLLTTIAASIGVYPIVAYHFNSVSPIAILANLFAVPLTGVAVPLLLASTALVPLSEWLASIPLNLASLVLSVMTYLVTVVAEIPFSSLRVSKPSIPEIFLFYSAALCLVNLKSGKRRLKLLFLFLAVLLLSGPLYREFRGRSDKTLRVTFISVGQGDSALVEMPGQTTMLIDGGGLYSRDFDTGERIVSPLLAHKRIRKIDYMVLSHAQRDHMEGLKFVAENFKVGEFWWNGVGDLGELKDTSAGKKIPLKVLRSPSEFNIKGVKVEVLNPPDADMDINDSSLVLRLTYGGRSFLFTGDIGSQVAHKLSQKEISADVLKSPHHGSRNSVSQKFLDKADPSLIVISVGRGNSFGFPHGETLKAYGTTGGAVLRTDYHGAVVVTTDGRTLCVETFGDGKEKFCEED